MKKVKSKILIFLLCSPGITWAGLYGSSYSRRRVRALTYEQFEFIIDVLEFIMLFCLAMLVSVPFFIRWSQKQKLTEEILLYQVRGKFTYLNVILWVEQIENYYGRKFNNIRKKLQIMDKSAKRNRGTVASYYKGDIKRLLFSLSFGKSRRVNAYKRMSPFTRFYVVSMLGILIIPALYAIYFWWGYEPPQVSNDDDKPFMLLGILMAFITSFVLWLFFYVVFNFIISRVEKILVKKKGHAGYLHIISAQLDGFFKGIWFRSDFPQAALMEFTDIEISNGKTRIIFKDFDGGGASGSW